MNLNYTFFAKYILSPSLCFLFSFGESSAQDKRYVPYSIGFYNVENLFDTLDNPIIRDDEFTPNGDKVWTSEKYNEKVANIASVISQLGKEFCKEGLSLLGVSEIENDTVLASIVSHPILRKRNYGYVHHTCGDSRGIDVALIYDKDVFEPLNVAPYRVDMRKPKTKQGAKPPRPTRDVLLVSGLFEGELIHVTINHWPSRSGGQKRTAVFRNRAAAVNRHILDSLISVDPMAKLIVMGDLNDDPNNASLIKNMKAEKNSDKLSDGAFFNPMHRLFDRGLGTLAYRDRWSLFDQIVLSPGFVKDESGGLKFKRANIYSKRYLIDTQGEYKGYPLRTFSGDVYKGGYSDHFPVYIYVLKEAAH